MSYLWICFCFIPLTYFDAHRILQFTNTIAIAFRNFGNQCWAIPQIRAYLRVHYLRTHTITEANPIILTNLRLTQHYLQSSKTYPIPILGHSMENQPRPHGFGGLTFRADPSAVLHLFAVTHWPHHYFLGFYDTNKKRHWNYRLKLTMYSVTLCHYAIFFLIIFFRIPPELIVMTWKDRSIQRLNENFSF